MSDKAHTKTKTELLEMLPRRSAIRNPSRLTRNLSRSATCSPIPSAKGGLARRDPRKIA
jgi:hypothetical protein